MWRFAQVLAYEGEIVTTRSDPGKGGGALEALIGIALLVAFVGTMYAIGVWLRGREQRRHGSSHFPSSSGRIDPHQL